MATPGRVKLGCGCALGVKPPPRPSTRGSDALRLSKSVGWWGGPSLMCVRSSAQPGGCSGGHWRAQGGLRGPETVPLRLPRGPWRAFPKHQSHSRFRLRFR